MQQNRSVPEFRLYTGKQVWEVMCSSQQRVIDAIEQAYVAHHRGKTVNPNSYFLKFPDKPRDRIIALPAHYESANGPVTGIKWISSFPGNLDIGLPRASAALILNDAETGYPVALMEASIISAMRTAASAVSALRALSRVRQGPYRMSLIGTGLISRYVMTMLHAEGVNISQVTLFDLNPQYAQAFAAHVPTESFGPVRIAPSMEDAVKSGDIIVIATTAPAPHITRTEWFEHQPLVLHLSLRDLSPEVMLSASNVVDDVEHSLQAQTSLHLTEGQVGHRDFVQYTLPGILDGGPVPPPGRTTIFSPFGMGILDLALANLVHTSLRASQEPSPDFFFDLQRI